MNTYQIRSTVGPNNKYTANYPDFKSMWAALLVLRATDEHAFGWMTVTYDEAVKIVKRPRLTRYIHVQHQAPAIHQTGYAFRATGTVRVSKADALEFMRAAYGYLKDKALVEMSLHVESIFIG